MTDKTITAKLRKYLIPNVPYLFALWFCLKLGTAYRLAEGANLGIRLTRTVSAIGPAFADFAPGLHAFDWLVGVTGAALLRLVIYCKVKNAKKFRRDVVLAVCHHAENNPRADQPDKNVERVKRGKRLVESLVEVRYAADYLLERVAPA